MVCPPVAAVIDVKEEILPHVWDQYRSVVLCTCEEAHRDGGLSESAHRCRSAAGFIISKPKKMESFLCLI